MTPERWKRIDQLLDSALKREESQRAAFLKEACGGDEALVREVESLLACESEAKAFIETPALEMVAKEMAEEPKRVLVGRQLGAYKITSLLGAGGMGEVYRAEDTRLGRAVAVKVLPEEMAEDHERLSRFVREARAASALNHANVAHIYEIGQSDGVHFIAMEYVEGQSLAQKMSGQPLDLREILDVGIQAADALEEAHRKRITHRDIKPANLMLTPTGQVKVLDFGLAKMTRPEGEVAGSDVSTSIQTAPGRIMGTLRYMSPEQVLGKELDARTDLFSLGVVLYEMTTGRLPFSGRQASEVTDRILHAQPEALARFNYDVPAELDRVIRKCLEKDRERRYQSARDLLIDLKNLKQDSDSGKAADVLPGRERWEERLTFRRPRWRWAWAALLPMLLAAGFFAWRTWRVPESTEPLQAVPLTTLPGVERYPSFSPDGNHIAFTWTGPKQDNPDIYVQQIGAGDPFQLTKDPGNDYSPVWSPDGRWIAFLRGQPEAGKNELRLIPPLGGPERKLGEIQPEGEFLRPVSLAWCPDSNCVVVTDSTGEGKPDALFVVSLESLEKRQLTYPQHPVTSDTDPAVSPDGRWLVFRRNVSRSGIGELYRLPLGGPASGASAATLGLAAAGEPSRLTPAALFASNPTWMPDSKEILFSDRGSLWRLGVTGASPPARLAFVGEDGMMPIVSRSQPGRPPRLVYVRSYADYNIWRVETSAAGTTVSSPPLVAISSTRWDGTPQISPDGRRVAFSSGRSGEAEIWLSDPDGSNAVQLTSMRLSPGFPRWSPDGKLIAFHSNSPEGQAEVYLIPTAGGKPRNLTSHPGTDSFPSFSRDGKWIYFSSNRAGGVDSIWKLPAFVGEAVRVTNSVGYSAMESADGAYIYYVENWDRPSPVWRLPASGGVAVKVLEGVVLASFAVIEGGIYYIDRPSGEARLQYFDFATRRSRTVARNLGNVGLGLTASPDGRTILYSRMDSSVDDLMLVENFR